MSLTSSVRGYFYINLPSTLKGSHADLVLGAFRTIAPVSASVGTVSIDFDAEKRTASGSWQTDISAGQFLVKAADVWRFQWWWWNLKSGAFLLLPTFYGLVLFLLFVLTALGRITLSGPLLILALIPAPFVFQRYIARIVSIFGIQALGPVQLGSQRVPNLTGPLFTSMDSFFVLRTKALLIWLAEQPEHTVTSEVLGRWAQQAGGGAAIGPELQALFALSCIKREQETFEVTDLGRRYVVHCFGETPRGPG